jgi:RimJ/RimL family protein N-acetyltransferase
VTLVTDATTPPDVDRPPPIALPVAPPDVIELPELTLRRWRPEWADALQAAFDASLPELRPFMPWATDDHGIDESREYIARSVEEWDRHENFNYALLTADGEVIGSAGLMTRMGEGVLEIGYWVHTAHTGRGHATATARALADAALALPGVDRAAIKHDPANPASGRVAMKAGFAHVGEVMREPAAPGHTGVELVWERRG